MTYQKPWVKRDLDTYSNSKIECAIDFRQLSTKEKTTIIRDYFLTRSLVIDPTWFYRTNSALIPFTCAKGHKHNLSVQNDRQKQLNQ